MSTGTSPSFRAEPPLDPFLIAAQHFVGDSDFDLVERMQTDLSLLMRQAWPIVEPATPFVHGWHLDTIAEHLTAVSDGEIRRLIVNIPPRTMKSLSCCVFWPAWEWLNRAHLRWLFATYADSLSQRDSLKMRRLIRSKGNTEKQRAGEGTIFERIGYQGVLSLIHEDPWTLMPDQDAKGKYENSETGFRIATSVQGMGTGEGGDRIVVDDPLNAKQARSDAERTFVNDWWDGTMSTRFNNAEAAAVIVMQRLHEDDLTGHLIERGGWHHLCLPAQYEPSHQFVYPAKVKLPSGKTIQGDRRTKVGQLLEPVRLAVDRLKELLRDLGTYAYAGQMQQRPAPADGGMFKAEWWKRYKAVPPQWDRVIQTWDMRFSDSQKASSSYVVGQVWGCDGADRYLLAQIRARLSFTETVKAVRALTGFAPHANAKLVEEKANGAAVIDTLKSDIGGIIPIQPEGGKDVRAAAAEPTVEAGNVYLPAAAFIPAPPGYEPTAVDDFIGEFSLFPNGAHDDQVDATTQALNWLASKQQPVGRHSYMGTHSEPVRRRGEIVLIGDQYVDRN